jgi:hypothetical protein
MDRDPFLQALFQSAQHFYEKGEGSGVESGSGFIPLTMDPDPGGPKTCSGSLTLITSAVDRHRCDANPDQNFRFNADPDPERHQNDANLYADPTQEVRGLFYQTPVDFIVYHWFPPY